MVNYDVFIKDIAPKKFSKRGMIWVSFLVIIIVAGIIAYIDQLMQGQVVTNMRDYVLWGIYISNFVFFVATSFVGSVAVAILRLTNTLAIGRIPIPKMSFRKTRARNNGRVGSA